MIKTQDCIEALSSSKCNVYAGQQSRPAGELPAQHLMSGHFAPLIERHGLAQRMRNALQFAREALHDTPRVEPRKTGEHDHAGGPLDQAADGRAIGPTLEQVALPVSRDPPRLDFGRPRGNLLRRPALPQAPSDVASQPAIRQIAWSARKPRPALRIPLSGGSPIPIGSGRIAPQLSAHRGETPAEADQMSRRHPTTDFLTFHGTRMAIALVHGNSSVANDQSVALVSLKRRCRSTRKTACTASPLRNTHPSFGQIAGWPGVRIAAG
jgi:hypothetical protein